MTPLFIPGVSMGLSLALFFRQLGIPPSLLTILFIHVLWALPFATLIILTVMAGFDPVYLEVAYMHGANRWRAFRDVELPLISPGIVSAGTFAMILSFNETERTALVQGQLNTVQTYIWSTYKQIGLSPSLYALMSLLILLTSRWSRSSRLPPSGASVGGAVPERCSIVENDECLGVEPTVTSEPAESNSRRIEVATTGWPSARRRR